MPIAAAKLDNPKAIATRKTPDTLTSYAECAI
jgi:hypothetical protein